MVWAAASKMGKLNLLILPVGTRIPGRLYRDMIRNHIVPELERVCGNRRYIFQQEGAPAHRAGDSNAMSRPDERLHSGKVLASKLTRT